MGLARAGLGKTQKLTAKMLRLGPRGLNKFHFW